MNNGAVYRHSSGGCLYVNDNNKWSVYEKALNPKYSSLSAPVESTEHPSTSGWKFFKNGSFIEDTTLTASDCAASDPFTTDNKCTLCMYCTNIIT